MASVFYIRCRPWGYDGAPIAKANNIAFFGYPMFRAPYDGANLKTCMADPSGPDGEWAVAQPPVEEGVESRKYRIQANKNRNMVRNRVQAGDIVMLPRPQSGVVHCATVKGFELVNNPPWAEQFRSMIKDGDPDRNGRYASEVCQCWHVDGYVDIPFPAIPGWIRSSLFGQASYNLLKSHNGRDPHARMKRLLEGESPWLHKWTIDPAQVEARLLEGLGPNSFEHLMVALLQLDRPHETWIHVGGSGDGGVDGIGADEQGNAVAILQCKWRLGDVSKVLDQVHGKTRRRILASLAHEKRPSDPDIEFLGLEEIAALVLKHHARLPQAMSLRVGTPL